MELTTGTTIKSSLGNTLQVIRCIGEGGQAKVYFVTDLSTQQNGVVKVFDKSFNNTKTIQRVQYLIDQKIYDIPYCCAPKEIMTGNMFSYFMPFVQGITLDQFFAQEDLTLSQAISIARHVLQVFKKLHECSIAHGDINSRNILMCGYMPYIIDLDNFYSINAPAPTCYGDLKYMAPEQRRVFQQKQFLAPDIYSDLYCIGVLLHELILMKHPVSGITADDEDSFHEVMLGSWIHDPLRCTFPFVGQTGGFPTGVLNTKLLRLFRKSINPHRDTRPTVADWDYALYEASQKIYDCPNCTCPTIVDPSKHSCPNCQRGYPIPQIKTKTGKTIVIDRASINLGRDNLGGSTKVSNVHASIQKIGPKIYIQHRSQNNKTHKWDGMKWQEIPTAQPITIDIGDKLKFADLELSISAIPSPVPTQPAKKGLFKKILGALKV